MYNRLHFLEFTFSEKMFLGKQISCKLTIYTLLNFNINLISADQKYVHRSSSQSKTKHLRVVQTITIKNNSISVHIFQQR